MSKPEEMVIDISGAGTVKGLHFEDFPLKRLGKAEITRATDIKFNKDTQSWDINLLDPEGGVIPHHPKHLEDFPDYEDAREHEVSYLQECSKKGIGIISEAGDRLGDFLRIMKD